MNSRDGVSDHSRSWSVMLLAWAALHLPGSGAAAQAVEAGVVPAAMRIAVGAFTGDYQGNWNTELTESEVDDISRYDLADSVLRLSLDADHRLRVAFFLDPGAAGQDQPLDLLGFGCNSRVGPLVELGRRRGEDGTQVTQASFGFDWGRCPSRVHAVAGTRLHMELADVPADRSQAVRLTLLRKVHGDYQVYAKIDGERHPVKVRPKPGGGGTLYHPELEYCRQDEFGEEICAPQRSKARVTGAPLPLPGATVLWWTAKTPNLRVEKGKKLLYHEAIYRRPAAQRSPG